MWKYRVLVIETSTREAVWATIFPMHVIFRIDNILTLQLRSVCITLTTFSVGDTYDKNVELL